MITSIYAGIFFIDGPFWKGQRRFSLRHMRDYGFGRRSEVVENFLTDEIKQIFNFLAKEPDKEDRVIVTLSGPNSIVKSTDRIFVEAKVKS